MSELLEVRNLSVSFDTPAGEIQAVRDVSFTVKAGEVLAIVGETGCGKSVLCKSILRLLPDIARIKAGRIWLNGADITDYRERDMCGLRGRFFAMVFQNPMTVLNPSLSVGAQIAEAIKIHRPGMSGQAVDQRVLELLRMVKIDHPEERSRQYPGHLSGGMRQRCVLAIALAAEPALLFADEPTTALDVTIQAQILDLFREVQAKLHMASIFVTHDLSVAAMAADRVAVMYAGRIVEIGRVEEIFLDPRHPYTWGLMRALPILSGGCRRLYSIPGMPPTLINPPKGDAFACRNEYALDIDYEEQPPMFPVTDTHFAATWLLDERAKGLEIKAPDFGWRDAGETGAKPAAELGSRLVKQTDESAESGSRLVKQTDESVESGSRLLKRTDEPVESDIILDVQHLTHIFPLSKKETLTAVDDVSFQVHRGEILGLIGESGSGKSTVARCIMNVYRPVSGKIINQGIDVCDTKAFRTHKKLLQSSGQIIFQDADASLNPRKKICDIIAEPMKLHRVKPRRGTVRAEAAFWLQRVGMDTAYLDQYPCVLSGGQRQRVAIARALSMKPAFLVADEPVASLDVSMQAQMVNLFKQLQEELGFSLLFIAHDLAMVRFLCDRVGVMHRGKLVEISSVKELFRHPKHPYTRRLVESIPTLDFDRIGQERRRGR